MSKIIKEEPKIAPAIKPEKAKRNYSKKNKAVARVNKNLPVTLNPQELILRAIDAKDFDVDKFERLVNMANAFEDRQAEKLFNEALAQFQSRCPVIEKKKIVYEKNSKKVRYKYAPIGSIVKQVSGLLTESGFSYIIDTEIKENGFLDVYCIIFHKAGASKKTTVRIPMETNQYMNNIQRVMSTMTYAKRTVFCNSFGIMTAEEDDDTNITEPEKKQQEVNTGQEGIAEYKKLMAYINDSNTLSKADKIKARVEANENVGNTVELKNLYSILCNTSKKTENNITNISDYQEEKAEDKKQESKDRSPQIIKDTNLILDSKNKQGVRIFSGEEILKYKRAVDQFIKEGMVNDALNALDIMEGIKVQRVGE